MRGVARREGESLAVGCLGAPGELLEEALDAMALCRPEATVDVRTFDYVQIWSSLEDGEVDLAVAYVPFGAVEIDDLDVLPLADEPRFVVLSASHALANRGELRAAELANEVFITHPEVVPESWRDFWLLTDQLGRRPALHPVRGDTVEKWLHLIQRGEGIDTCPAYVARYYAWPAINYVPLRDAPPTTLAMLLRKGSGSPLVDAFKDAIVAAAANHSV